MTTNERLASVRGAFRERFGRTPEGVAEAPGRVNLIGEHLDYNEGLVLPAAIDRSVLVAYAPRDDAEVRMYAIDFAEESGFRLDQPIARDDQRPWSNYVRGVFATILADRAGHAEGRAYPCGLELALTGDVPIGAGLASSAALEVATAGALRAAWGLDLDDRGLALLCQRAENEFVGVQCGVMDQLASALGREGCALLIDCRTLGHEAIVLGLEEEALDLVIVDSGVRRELTSSAYNRRRAECAEALRLLRGAIHERPIDALRDVSLDDLVLYNDRLPPVLFRRARHVITEQQRVIDSVDALRQRDLASLGGLMNASHASLRDDFAVSSRELDRLVERAQSVRGVLGARLTGAGFGGCTVQLVQREVLDAFGRDVVERYRRETGRAAQMHVCRAAGGLRLHEAPA